MGKRSFSTAGWCAMLLLVAGMLVNAHAQPVPGVTDLAVRAKDEKAQLTWTSDPNPSVAGYNIYRSTISGGPYLKIGATTSTYSTFLDSTVANGTTYYYIIRGKDVAESELYQSNQSTATPSDYSPSALSNPSRAPGGVTNLWAFGLNIDGTPHYAAGLPGTANAAAFDFVTGLGSITITVTGAGVHSLDLFTDHEIDEGVNTFFNEFGSVFGAPVAGQSWEIDEPLTGDIINHLLSSALENANGTSANNDVSMALGWDFILGSLEQASITYRLSTAPPSGGFYLSQTDQDSATRLFFTSTLLVEGRTVPEPATLALLGLGLAGLSFSRRKQ